MGENIPNLVKAVHDLSMALSDAQRVALAIEMTRNIEDEHCILPLRRLETMAHETQHELWRRAQARDARLKTRETRRVG